MKYIKIFPNDTRVTAITYTDAGTIRLRAQLSWTPLEIELSDLEALNILVKQAEKLDKSITAQHSKVTSRLTELGFTPIQ